MTAGTVARRLLGVLLFIAGGLALATSGVSAQTPVPPHLRVVTKSLPPFVITGDSTPQGFSMDLLDKLAARLDFTYELQVVDTVAEQLQKVQDGEADLAIAGIASESMATVGYGDRRPRTLWGHLAAVFWMYWKAGT